MGPCTANDRRRTVDSRCRGTAISCCVADLRRCLPTTSVTGVQQSTRYCGAFLAMPTSVHDDTEFVRVRTLLDLPHRASVSHHARFESGHGRTFLGHCILMTVMTATSTMLVVFLRLHADDNGGDQRRERAARQLVEQDGLPAVSDRLRRRSRQHLAISLPRLPERRRSVLLLRSRSL